MATISRNKPSVDYIAGLFDGEGWFTISVNKNPPRCKGPALQIHAAISLRQPKVLHEIQKQFGGTVTLAAKATTKHAEAWRWRVTGDGALKFAEQVGGKLIVKKQQAKLAILFQTLKAQNKNRPSSITRRNQLAKLRERIQLLNKKGPR